MTRNEQILALSAKGLSLGQIATKLNITKGVVAGVVDQVRHAKRRQNYETARAIERGAPKLAARRAKIVQILATRKLSGRCRQWLTLYASGLTQAQVAAAAGVSRATVSAAFCALGIDGVSFLIHPDTAIKIARREAAQ